MSEHQPDLRSYLLALRRQFWLIGLITAVAVGAAIAVSALQTPVYRASMKIVVGQGGGVFQPQFGGTVQPFVETMSSLFTSDVVATTTIQTLGLHETPKQLLAKTHVSTTPDSSVLGVTYDSTQPREAVRVLAQMGTVFTTLIAKELQQPAALVSQVTATVWDPAHVEPGTVSPRLARNVGFAAVLGLALALVLALVRENVDTRIRTRRDAERWFGAPVLGALPRGMRGRIAVAGAAPPKRDLSQLLNAMGMVRASLQFLGDGMACRVITVTSAAREEGKTTLVANLGVELAAAGHRVICVEADLRRPKLREYLSAPLSRQGLADVLAGDAELDDALLELLMRPSANGSATRARDVVRALLPGLGNSVVTDLQDAPPRGRLHLLPAGEAGAEAADLLSGNRVEKLVEDLHKRADYVIFDTPPILDVGDAYPFARAADIAIVVAREGQATQEMAASVRNILERLEVGRVGVVLVDSQAPHDYGVGYGAE